jgi:hypothetical protein
MEMSRPKFTLNRLCPVCEQGSSLLFLTCARCGKVIIVCDEEGTLFPNPMDLEDQADYPCDPWISTVTKCPACQTVQEFRFSSGEEIQGLGFSPVDYA